MPTAQEIFDTYPEFATAAAPVKATYLLLAELRTADAPIWDNSDDVRNLAVALMAAYMMAKLGLGVNGASAGAITSERIGSAAVTYASPLGQASDEDLLTNAYGRALVDLRNQYIMAPRTSLG